MPKRHHALLRLLGALGLLLVSASIIWPVVDIRVGKLWLNTSCLALGVCAVAILIGTFLAVGIAKTNFPGRGIAAWLLTAMLFMPLFLIAGAWDAGFGLQGWHTLSTNPHLAHEPWLSGWSAAIWVHALAATPWVTLILGAAMRAVEPEIEEDAALCGPPWKVLLHVTIPRSASAFLVASVLVAVACTTEIAVTDLYQVRTFAEEAYTQSALGSFDFNPGAINNWPSAPISTAGLWFGVFLSAALAVTLLLGARRLIIDLADASHRRPWVWRLGRERWFVAVGVWMTLFVVAGVPLVNLIHKAGVLVTATDSGRVREWSLFKVAERVAVAPLENGGEILQSAQIGVAAATAALLIGAPLAWSLRTTHGWPVIRLVALALCLTIPGPVLGIALIRLLNQAPDSPLSVLAPLYDSRFAPWLAQTIRALPFETLILWSAVATVPQSMFDAAMTDGVGWWGRLFRIALPQRWPAVGAAWLIGLAIAVGELAATVLVMPPARHTVISVRVFQLLHFGVDDRVAAVCLVIVFGIAILTAIAATLVKRSRVGAN